MQMTMMEEGKELDETSAFALVQQYWAPRVVDQVKSIRNMKDKTGVVFDVFAKSAEGFVESYENLKEKNPARVNFVVCLCKALPDLEEDSGLQHEGTFNADGSYGEVKVYPEGEAGDGEKKGGRRRDGEDDDGDGDGRRGGGYDDDQY